MSEIDIYKLTPIEVPTSEHILLNALGGKLEVTGLIDIKTNSTFGDTIDGCLTKAVDPVRVLFDAKSGDNQKPPRMRKLQGKDGQQYDLNPGGKPEMSHSRAKVTPTKNGLLIEGQARSLDELKALLKRPFAKHGIPLDKLNDEVKRETVQVPQLRISFNFDEGCVRAIAKMACNLFATENKDVFLRPEFNEIRDYVLNGGSHNGRVRPCPNGVTINEAGRGLGKLDHLLLVKGDGKSGEVHALVVIYGHIQYQVFLGKTDLPGDISLSLRVDQIGRQSRHNDAMDQSIVIPSIKRPMPKPKKLMSAWTVAIDAIMRAHEDAVRHSIIERTIDEVLGTPEEGDVLTEEQVNTLSALLGRRMAEYFSRLMSDE